VNQPLRQHADFMRLWIAQTISVFGSGFTQLALPLIAANTLRASSRDGLPRSR
jgi:hypothetical protein